MKATTALKTSFMQGDLHLHIRPLKLSHSRSPEQLSYEFQAPSGTTSLNMCVNEKLPKNRCISRTRTRSSEIECRSSLTDTFSASTTTISAPNTNTNNNTTTTTNTSVINYNGTHSELPTPIFRRRQPEYEDVGVQELTVYEVNERDRDSPVLLFSSKLSTDWYKRLTNIANLGDLIPFSNKLFDGSLKKRLGITAGIISVIRYYPKEIGVLFEAVYSFYFGDFGHISVMGPYKTHEDTILTVTGGSGIFNGVYGTVEIRNIEFPTVLFYTFKLYGIAQLPKEFEWTTVPPVEGVRPSPNASSPGVALRNFTD